jgi:hyaluronan synthase
VNNLYSRKLIRNIRIYPDGRGKRCLLIMRLKYRSSSSSSRSSNCLSKIKEPSQTVSNSTGKINISKKGWIIRISTLLFLISLILIYNLYFGLINPKSLPIMIYTGIVMSFSIMILTLGWICYRNPAIYFKSPSGLASASGVYDGGEHSSTLGTEVSNVIRKNHYKDMDISDKACQTDFDSTTDLTKGESSLVSVIIPIYNQKNMIRYVIDSILNSTYRNIEIIAINDGSNDGTKELLDEFKNDGYKHSNLKIIHKQNGGKRKAVAKGFFESKGKYLVLIDSDSIIDKNAIEQIVNAFSTNPDLGALTGHAKILNADRNFLTKCQDAWYDYEFNVYKACESYFGSVTCCCGCLSAYRRETIEKFVSLWIDRHDEIKNSASNSFDEIEENTSSSLSPSVPRIFAPTLSTPKPQLTEVQSPSFFSSISNKLLRSLANYDDSEDRALTTYSLTKCKSAYVSNAIVYTEVPEKLNGFIKQQQRWKKGTLRANLFASTFVWSKNNPIMSLIFYAGFALSVLSPIITIASLLYCIFTLHNILFPLFLVNGYLMIGFFEGLDYKMRDPSAKYWKYRPIMNLILAFVVSWLTLSAIANYRKDVWLTR